MRAIETTIINKRDKLEKLNRELFFLLKSRELLVKEIYFFKFSQDPDPIWGYFDCGRELDLFGKYKKSLLGLSLEEILGFSLIMEAHAKKSGAYPSWSTKDHLDLGTSDEVSVVQMCNPVMLSVYNYDLFKSLPIKESMAQIIAKYYQ